MRCPRLRAVTTASTLATLTVPYGYPSRGSVNDHRWASIHSSPPWEDLDAPMMVSNEFGAGRAIYSPLGIEGSSGDAESRLFIAAVRSLLWSSFFRRRDASGGVDVGLRSIGARSLDDQFAQLSGRASGRFRYRRDFRSAHPVAAKSLRSLFRYRTIDLWIYRAVRMAWLRRKLSRFAC